MKLELASSLLEHEIMTGYYDRLYLEKQNFNIKEDVVETIETLYKSLRSAVLLNNQIGDSRECLSIGTLSPKLFDIFLEYLMEKTLHNLLISVSIGGNPLCNLRFVDDVDLKACSNIKVSGPRKQSEGQGKCMRD